MKILAIRHLPTDWNKEGLLQGKVDRNVLPLTRDFEVDVNKNKMKLDQFKGCDCVLVSELNRTKQTAQAYGFDNFLIEPLLNELDFGEFEGKPKQYLVEECKGWLADPRDLVLGEPIGELQIRIQSFLNKYRDKKLCLVFGHGTWIRGLLSLMEFGDLSALNQVQVKNNQLIELDV